MLQFRHIKSISIIVGVAGGAAVGIAGLADLGLGDDAALVVVFEGADTALFSRGLGEPPQPGRGAEVEGGLPAKGVGGAGVFVAFFGGAVFDLGAEFAVVEAVVAFAEDVFDLDGASRDVIGDCRCSLLFSE